MLDPNLEKLKDISDKLSKGQLDPVNIAGLFNGIKDPMPSVDDIKINGEALMNSLKPQQLILNDEEINDLICQYSGEELGNRILWSILRKQGYTNNIDEPDFKSNTKFDKFLIDNNLSDNLQLAKEMISDNLDLDSIGIVFNSPNIKTRNYSVGPFNFKINVITSKGTPLFYQVVPPQSSVDTILKRIRDRISSNKTKQCVIDFNYKYSSPYVDESVMLEALENIIDNDQKLKESNNIFDVIDSIFCDPIIPINSETGNPLFNQNDLEIFLKDICEPVPETIIPDPLPVGNIEDISSKVSLCLDQIKGVFNGIKQNSELKSRYQKAEAEINEIYYYYQIIQNYYKGLYDSFVNTITNIKKIPVSKITIEEILNSKEATDYLNLVRGFSCRIKKTSITSPKIASPQPKSGGKSNNVTNNSTPNVDITKTYYGLNFNIEFSTGLGEPLPYQTTNAVEKNPLFSQDDKIIDMTKLQIGMEFSDGGIFSGFKHDFFSSLDQFITFNDKNPKLDSDLYSFINDIENTKKSKDEIIGNIENDHGFLYSNLLEVSSSNWLFFDASERGDNDSRSIKDLKPAIIGPDGDPNKEFTDFYGNFKKSWDSKYNKKLKDVNDRIEEIKSISDSLANKIASFYINSQVNSFYPKTSSTPINISNLSDTELNKILDSPKKILQEASEKVSKRVELIEYILLEIGTQIEKIDNENSQDSIKAKVGSINCGTPSPDKKKTLSIGCPSECCGSSGSAIDSTGIGGVSSAPDCPDFYTTCYWKEFSKKLNTVGSIPIPAGLPPIENPMPYPIGIKYWPVGYLPPSFIPLPPPLINPLDGMPFIRIPLPMIWTAIDPIIIPLPIGLIVIFIPLVGGFMPSPLVFLHDFLTTNSVFILGLRGFRFIPKKSDPTIDDVLKNYKKSISRGVPHYMFPFPNIGENSVDNKDRIKNNILGDIEKQIGNINRDFDFSDIQKLQDEIGLNIDSYDSKILSESRKSALFDSNSDQYKKEKQNYLDSLNGKKISAIKKSIDSCLTNIINLPDIHYPKQSKNLIAEIPSSVKIPNDISSKQKLGSIPVVKKINLKSRLISALSNQSVDKSPDFNDVNKRLSPKNQIVDQLDVEIGKINTDQNSLDKLKALVGKSIGKVLEGDNSPLSYKSLLLYGSTLNPISKSGGSEMQLPSSVDNYNDPRIEKIKGYISDNITLKASEVIEFAKNNSIDGNKVIRVKDIKLLSGNVLDKIISKYPDDLKNFEISNPLSSIKSSLNFSSFAPNLEIPAFPPKKSGNPSVPIGIGGIPQITIPGSSISNFFIKGSKSLIDSQDYNKLVPGGLDNFIYLSKTDVKNIAVNILKKFAKESTIPEINNLPSIPLKSRPQDFVEFIMSFLPTHPESDIAFTLEWNLQKSPPRIPISAELMLEYKKLQNSIFSNLPWQVVILLGRNIINLLNPLYNREDLPRWDRMSLKNPFFVVFLDEFLRSATDISGGFKYFVGPPAQGILYPLPDLEIPLGFGTKIDIN